MVHVTDYRRGAIDVNWERRETNKWENRQLSTPTTACFNIRLLLQKEKEGKVVSFLFFIMVRFATAIPSFLFAFGAGSLAASTVRCSSASSSTSAAASFSSSSNDGGDGGGGLPSPFEHFLLETPAMQKRGLPTVEEAAYVKMWGIPWVADWDNPQRRGIDPNRSRSVQRQILLIRHGQYQNEESSDDSIRTLTKLGEQQAALTGEFLYRSLSAKSKLFVTDAIRFVYVSDMTRAQQTAKIISDRLQEKKRNLTTDSLLREKFPCDTQPVYTRKAAKYKDMRLAEEAFERYFHRPTSNENTIDVVVGHGNMIRYFLCRALQLPPEAWLRFSIPHCSVTSITMQGNGNVKCSFYGSFSHLPEEMHTLSNFSGPAE